MLKVNKNTEIFEAVSEVDGMTIMTFRAEVDKQNPAESSMDVKKESEQLYREHRDQASYDREQFEDMVFAMLDEYENPHPVEEPEVIDGEYVEADDKSTSEVLDNIASSWQQVDEQEKNRIVDELVGCPN